MPAFCVKCAKDPFLAALISEAGSLTAECAICGTFNIMSLDCNDNCLRNLFRALVRYNFSEWEYNTHMGGDDLERLLRQENPITAYETIWNTDNYEEALSHIFHKPYEDYDKGISMFSGYDEGGEQLPALSAIKDSSDSTLVKLQRQLEEKNYFLLEEDARKLLVPHTRNLERFIEAEKILYRSRIGFKHRATPLFGWGDTWHYKPYDVDQLSAPRPLAAGGGRLNRPGVAYLYLATDEKTAISEVRPHPGHHVSVGAFQCSSRLRIADFNAISIREYCDSDHKLRQYLFLKTIDKLFSLPVPPEERGRYSFTQFLSDALRHVGFDGIAYRSSVASGVNLAVFDPCSFSYVAGSAKVVRIDHLEYDYSGESPWKVDDDYMTDQNGDYLQ